MELASILIPGLIVVEIAILLKYVPFADAGFSFAMVLIISIALSLILSDEKEAFPMLT